MLASPIPFHTVRCWSNQDEEEGEGEGEEEVEEKVEENAALVSEA